MTSGILFFMIIANCQQTALTIHILILQAEGGESISGKQVDRFYQRGRMGKYIESRNVEGAGMC